MIAGRHDTYFTIEEFAAMIGREAKTVRNWAAEGRLRFAHLCGVPLVSLQAVESLIAGTAPAHAADATTALRLMNRADRAGRRAIPGRRSQHPSSAPSAVSNGA